MKKRFLTLLLLLTICCTALSFAGCYEGHEVAEMTCNGTFSYTQMTQAEFSAQNLEELACSGENGNVQLQLASGEFNKTGEPSITLSAAVADGATITGLDTTKVGTFTMTISYDGYTCEAEYTVTAAG